MMADVVGYDQMANMDGIERAEIQTYLHIKNKYNLYYFLNQDIFGFV